MLRNHALRITALLVASAFSLACSSDSDTKAPSSTFGPSDFESDAPGSAGNGRLQDGGIVTGPGAAGNSIEGEGASDSAARAIEEADIVKIDGGRLYALSQFGGLSVIDVSTRDRLRLLGRKKVQALPFEMYTRENTVFALYNGYGEYVRNEKDDGWNWVTTSTVIAFDTQDPANIVEIGRFGVPGMISDSRIVGDVLYVVGFENGACWGCGTSQRTTVLSLDVKNPGTIRKIDELSFSDALSRTYSWQRSIAVTDQRIYVAGPEYGTNSAIGSTIQVVDISDPGGDLVEGTTIRAAGRIANRWQMDEFEGILRVISQKGDWRPDLPPKIQTFRVQSSSSILPLGSADMAIPRNEDLRSVRFDGPRGYAITALQTDPLFTIDLSNPALPRQVGELEIPGWVYHMEPRGDRVLGLGFDQNNPAGGLNISLFDVSNFAAPRLVDRVNFGGEWASVAEDQDRIHKALKIVDEAGLILMPFSGWTRGDDPLGCSGRYETGIQLIDWMNDELTLGGVAPASGLARRGFLHDDRLFAVSDDRVETFDISNRNTPKSTAELALSHWVSRTIPSGDHVIRVAQNWQTNVTELDVTKVSNVTSPESLGHLEIRDVEQNRCFGNSWLRDVVSEGNRVYVVYDLWEYAGAPEYKETRTTRVLTVDVSDPEAPTQIGDALLDFGQTWGYSGIAGVVDRGATLVASGSTLVALSGEPVVEAMTGRWLREKVALRVVDMSDPNAPTIVTHELASADGTTGLHVSGTEVAFGHYTLVNANRIRFYMSRFDVADPTQPALLGTTNVPGSLMAYDAAGGRALTADYRRQSLSGITAEECFTKHANAEFNSVGNVGTPNALGVCSVVLHGIRLVQIGQSGATVIGAVDLGANESIGSSALGDDRLFVIAPGSGYRFYGAVTADTGLGLSYSPVAEVDVPLLVIGGLKSGTFRVGRTTLKAGDSYGYSPLAASGTQAVLSSGWRGKLTVVDATDIRAPHAVREEAVFGGVEHLVTAGNVGIASLGPDGVQTIPLGK